MRKRPSKKSSSSGSSNANNNKRKNRNNNDNQSSSSSSSSSDNAPPDDRREQEPQKLSKSNSSSFLSEFVPFAIITIIVVLPYALHNAYLYVLLQRPDIVNRYFSSSQQLLRPALKTSDMRQVLIVGTISSGTKQVSHDLSSSTLEGGLELEIGHENSVSEWNFVRDGTVSWFHGIRFLKRPSSQLAAMIVIEELCHDFHPNMGFHPLMFRNNLRSCSYRSKWNDCWKNECIDVLNIEWGCALKKGKTNNCLTPFRKTLHQVRNPLRTIESLVSKFCVGNGLNGTVQPAFKTFVSKLFPMNHYDKAGNENIVSKLSCIEIAGYYVYEYNTAILDAAAAAAAAASGDDDDDDAVVMIDGTYHIEDVTPCDIAIMAGFTGGSGGKDDDDNDDDTVVVYKPNKEKVSKICSGGGSSSNNNSSDYERDASSDAANKLLNSTKNSYNKGRKVKLIFDDLLGGKHGSKRKINDDRLQKQIVKLWHKLGY